MIFPKAIIVELDGVLSDNFGRRHLIDPEHNEDCQKAYEDYHWTGTPLDRTKFTWMCGKINEEPKPFKPDWQSYHAAASSDEINSWCFHLLDGINRSIDDLEVLYVTSTPEKYRNSSEQWIRKWCWPFIPVNFPIKLFMRPKFLPSIPKDKCVICNNLKYVSAATKRQNLCDQCVIDTGWVSRGHDNRPAAIVKREIYEKEIAGKYEVLFCLERDEDCCAMWKGLGLQVLSVI